MSKKNGYLKSCIICNAQFRVPLSWANKKYCSIKCSNISKIGKKHSDAHKMRISEGIKKNLPSTAFKKGFTPWNKGKECPKGEMAANWKGGRIFDSRGYVRIYNFSHPFCNKRGYVFEHRLVLENSIGRYLKPEEVVHHINRNINDNRLENLKLFSNNSEHIRYHAQLKGA